MRLVDAPQACLQWHAPRIPDSGFDFLTGAGKTPAWWILARVGRSLGATRGVEPTKPQLVELTGLSNYRVGRGLEDLQGMKGIKVAQAGEVGFQFTYDELGHTFSYELFDWELGRERYEADCGQDLAVENRTQSFTMEYDAPIARDTKAAKDTMRSSGYVVA